MKIKIFAHIQIISKMFNMHTMQSLQMPGLSQHCHQVKHVFIRIHAFALQLSTETFQPLDKCFTTVIKKRKRIQCRKKMQMKITGFRNSVHFTAISLMFLTRTLSPKPFYLQKLR